MSFEQVRKNKLEAELGRTSAYFVALDDLIEMERASGRSQDLQDLRYLLDLERRGQSDDGCGGEVLPEVTKNRGMPV